MSHQLIDLLVKYGLRGGQLNITDVVSLKGDIHLLLYAIHMGFHYGESTLESAIQGGDLHCIQELIKRGCPRSQRIGEFVVQSSHPENLVFLVEGGYLNLSKEMFSILARSGRVELLRFCHQHHCPMDQEATAWAAHRGHLECLEFLHEISCPVSATAMIQAAKENQVLCLEYLHRNGCPWNRLALQAALKNGSIECLEYIFASIDPELPKEACEYASKSNHLECLKFCYQNGAELTYNVLQNALLNKNYDMVDFILTVWDPDLYLNSNNKSGLLEVAAQVGDLRVFKRLYKDTLAFPESLSSSNVCAQAAMHGHFDILQYAHENGFPWDQQTTTNAAANQQTSCLQYAIQNGCPWDISQSNLMAYHCNIHILNTIRHSSDSRAKMTYSMAK